MRTWYSISFACVLSSDFAALVQWLTNQRAQLMNPLADDEGKTVWVMDIKLQLRSVSMCGPVSSRSAAWISAARRFRQLKSSSKLNFSIFRSAQSVHPCPSRNYHLESSAPWHARNFSEITTYASASGDLFSIFMTRDVHMLLFFVTRIDEALDAHNERGSPRSPSYANDLIMSHS